MPEHFAAEIRKSNHQSPFKLRLHYATKHLAINYIGREMIQYVAALTDPMFDIACAVRDGKLDRLLPKRPESDQWLCLYRDHDAITRGIGNAMPDLWGLDGDQVLDVLDGTRCISNQARRDPKAFASQLLENVNEYKFRQWWRITIRQLDRNYKQHLVDLREFVRGRDPEDVHGQFERAIQQEPAVYFFIRVILPAIVVWQTTPQRLLRQARSAKKQSQRTTAIERLVRLDPMAICLPVVMEWQNVDDGNTRHYREQQVLAWRSQGLDYGKFTVLDFKSAMGGLILATARRMGRYMDAKGKFHDVNIKAQDVRGLMDAAAQDRVGRTKGVCDEDIEGILPSTWSRRLRHYRKIWDQLIPEIPGSK